MKVLVLTISDRASKGVYEDRSGPAVVKTLSDHFQQAAVVQQLIVPDEQESILKAFGDHGTCDIIITTGGTGIGPRDVTPEVTAGYCDRLIPGIAELLRAESYRQTPNAMLSRGIAGIKGNTIIINLPGSPKAAAFCTGLLIPVLSHALDMIRQEGHEA